MEIITMARQLGVAIQQSPEFLALQNAKAANEGDAELNNQIGEFNLKKVEIDNLMSEGKQDSLDQKNEELKKLYLEIMQNPNMLAFNKTTEAMNKMMSYINNILIAAVNGDNPETCDIEPQNSCATGGCSGCSGCN